MYNNNGTCLQMRRKLFDIRLLEHRYTNIISIQLHRCTLMFWIHRYIFQVCEAVCRAFRVLAGRTCWCYARWRRVRARRTIREKDGCGSLAGHETRSAEQSRAGQARPGSNVPSKSHPLPRYRAYSRRKVCTPLLASTRSLSLSRRCARSLFVEE